MFQIHMGQTPLESVGGEDEMSSDRNTKMKEIISVSPILKVGLEQFTSAKI